jgi:FkbM family methyltransferase
MTHADSSDTLQEHDLKLTALRSEFESGKLGKLAYNARAYRVHRRLFEYPPFLRGTNVSSVELTEAGVVFVLRDPSIRMWCTPEDQRHTAVTTLNFRQYERQDFDAVIQLAEASRVFFDIGANVGYYSLAIGKRFPNAKVIAFEPIPNTYRELTRNIDLNHLRNVTAYPIGLSDCSREAPFYYDATVSGATSGAPLGSGFTTEILLCPIETIDDFVTRNGIVPDLIKCDVEGAELQVFRGALKTLERSKPMVFTEMLRKWAARYEYHPNEIISLFRDIGYQCFTFSEGSLHGFLEMTPETVETNFFFLHAQRHLELVRSLGWLR